MDQRRLRGERNRRALIDAAVALFATDGFDETTVDAIAEAAGVAPRTFFHHFPTKESVLFDGYPERLAGTTRRFRAAGAERSLWEALTGASTAFVEAIEAQPELFLLRSRLYRAVPSLRATMLRLSEEWIDGLAAEIAARLGVEPGDDVRPRLVASLLNVAHRSALEVWAAGSGTADLGALVAECVALIEPAVSRIERTAPSDVDISRAG